MAEENILPIRDEFPRWYREVDISENRPRLDARWKGVSLLVRAADRKSVETMLAVLLKAKSRPDAEALATLRGHFKAADDLFEMSGNDRELEILCGTALVQVLDGTSDVAARAALMTSIGFFAEARKADFPFNFAAAAETTIAKISEQRRNRLTVTQLGQVTQMEVDAESIEILKQEFSYQHVVGAVNAVANQVRAVAHDMTTKANAAIRAIEHLLAVQDEELQILWWLFGGRSTTLDRPFTDVPVDAQPIVLASEAADATRFIPGPISVKPILSRAGLKERITPGASIAAAINACDGNFLQKLVEGVEPAPVVRPLHFAIHRKLEAGDDTSWTANWSAVTGIDAQLTLPGIELGNLFYRERLCLKFGG